MIEHSEYVELRALILAHGTPEARRAAEHYLIGLFVRDLNRV